MEKKKVVSVLGSRFPLKIIAGVLIAVLLLIPMQMVESLIIERQKMHDNVARTISRDWGEEQTLIGPFLIVPFKDSKYANVVTYYNQDNVRKKSLSEVEMVFNPDQLLVSTDIKPVFKHRGIYKYVVYTSDIQLKGSFESLDFSDIKLKNRAVRASDLDWDNARLEFDITDTKGISGETKIYWNNSLKSIKPVNNSSIDNGEGFYCDAKIDSNSQNSFFAKIKLKGSRALHFAPLGKITNLNMNTHWESPKFVGNYSPDSSYYDGEIYKSSWSISQLARQIPNSYLSSSSPDFLDYSFGVEMIEPVDKYQQTLRSAKYSILFIILSFLTIFFSEIYSKKETNVLQYILIGIALVLFYSILLSLTEQMSFALAYLISASAIIIMVSLYSHSIFKSLKTSAIMFSFWVILYSFLYFVLQLQDFALLAGNIGLFIVLSLVMYFSRKINLSPSSEDKYNEIIVDKGDSL